MTVYRVANNSYAIQSWSNGMTGTTTNVASQIINTTRVDSFNPTIEFPEGDQNTASRLLEPIPDFARLRTRQGEQATPPPISPVNGIELDLKWDLATGVNGSAAPFALGRTPPDTTGWTVHTLTLDESQGFFVPDGRTRAASKLILDLDDSENHVIVSPYTIRRPITLRGGGDIVWKAAHTHLQREELDYFYGGDYVFALTIEDGVAGPSDRTVHLEGHRLSGNDLGKGIVLSEAPSMNLRLMYFDVYEFGPRNSDAFGTVINNGDPDQFPPKNNDGTRMYQGVNHNHSDLLKTNGEYKSLYMERCTARPAMVGLHFDHAAESLNHIRKVNIVASEKVSTEEGPITDETQVWTPGTMRADFESSQGGFTVQVGSTVTYPYTADPINGTKSLQVSKTDPAAQLIGVCRTAGTALDWSASGAQWTVSALVRVDQTTTDYPMMRIDISDDPNSTASGDEGWWIGQSHPCDVGVERRLLCSFPIEVVENIFKVRVVMILDDNGTGSGTHSFVVDDIQTGVGYTEYEFGGPVIVYPGKWAIYLDDATNEAATPGIVYFEDFYAEVSPDNLWKNNGTGNGSGVNYSLRYWDPDLEDYVLDPPPGDATLEDYFFPSPPATGTDGTGDYVTFSSTVGTKYRDMDSSDIPGSARLYEGPPPGGNWCPDGVAGLNYTSPSYSDVALPTNAEPLTLVSDTKSQVDGAVLDFKWDMPAQVSGGVLDLTWDTIAQINSATERLVWDTRAGVDSASQELIWDTRAEVSSPVTELIWDTRSAADGGILDFKWDLAAAVDGASQELIWDLIAQVDSGVLDLNWDLIAQTSGIVLDLIWDLRSAIDGAVLDFKYDLYKEVTGGGGAFAVRELDGSDDEIQFAQGDIPSDLSSFTLLALVKPLEFNSSNCVMAIGASGGGTLGSIYFGSDGSVRIGTDNPSYNGISDLEAVVDEWQLVAVTLTGDGATPRLHLATPGGAWAHDDSGAGAFTWATPASLQNYFGRFRNGGGLFNCRYAVAALWDRALSDAELESLGTNSLSLTEVSGGEPISLWEFNQTSVVALEDALDTADEVGHTGTTAHTDDPDLEWSFGLEPAGGVSLVWDTKAEVASGSQELIWDLRAETSANALDLVWDLSSENSVNADPVQLVWDTIAQVNSTSQELIWDLNGAVSGNVTDFVWDLNAEANSVVTELVWDLIAQVNGAQTELIWDLIAAADGGVLDLTWDLIAQVNGNVTDLIWDLNSEVGGGVLDFVWDLRTQANGGVLDLNWDTIAQVNGAQTELIWDLIAQTNANELELIWDLVAQGQVNGDPSRLVWDTIAEVASPQTELIWDLRSQVNGTSQELIWDLIARVNGAARVLKWDLYAETDLTRRIRWDLRAAVGATCTFVWDLRNIINAPELRVLWDVEHGLAPTYVDYEGALMLAINPAAHSLVIAAPTPSGVSVDAPATNELAVASNNHGIDVDPVVHAVTLGSVSNDLGIDEAENTLEVD